MAAKTSRYKNALPFSGVGGAAPVFGGFRPRTIGRASGVLEHTIKAEDRLDLLALYYYVDNRKWWRILDANPDIVFGADLAQPEAVGETALIPRASEPGAPS